jgi:MFS family permease
MSPLVRRTFSSLSVRNYRRYFAGQIVSISGNWMQTVAEMWLIVQLTGSGVAVGLTAALQFLPILLFGAWGGVLADRLSKRRLIMSTQLLMAIPAVALWGLTFSGVVETWMVFALVLTRGMVTAVDNPARQSFVSEIVGSDRVVNAVALNSVVIHSSRIIGPAVAGTVIALFDLSFCFLLNAISFAVMFLAVRSMDPDLLDTPRPAPRARGELRSALRYVAATPELRIPLAMMALVGTLSFNFQVLMPLLAHLTWQGDATTYSALTIAMGVGSVGGALAAGARGRVDGRLLVGASAGFGLMLLVVASAPTLPLQLAVLVPLGALSVTFAAGVNSALQLAVAPAMRGRVMALYSTVFLGSTPIGSLLVGWLSEASGPRAGLALGGLAALVAAVGAHIAFGRARRVTAGAASGARPLLDGATARAAPVHEPPAHALATIRGDGALPSVHSDITVGGWHGDTGVATPDRIGDTRAP